MAACFLDVGIQKQLKPVAEFQYVGRVVMSIIVTVFKELPLQPLNTTALVLSL
jgi:hypothetical protein